VVDPWHGCTRRLSLGPVRYRVTVLEKLEISRVGQTESVPIIKRLQSIQSQLARQRPATGRLKVLAGTVSPSILYERPRPPRHPSSQANADSGGARSAPSCLFVPRSLTMGHRRRGMRCVVSNQPGAASHAPLSISPQPPRRLTLLHYNTLPSH
jgi:hypothetical protein